MGDSRFVEGRLPYPFKTRPYKHQLDCWNRQRDEKSFAIYAEMGLGKSKMLIDTSAYLYDKGCINGFIVIAPKSVYRNWADAELPTHMPEHIRYKVGIWDADPKKEELEALNRLFLPGDDDLHVLLINVESLTTERARKLLEKFLLGHTALCAVDESTTIKNPSAKRTKAVIKLGRYAKYRRLLSGEPAPDSPLDMYSQAEFLDPNLLGFGSFFTYKARFAKQKQMKINGRTFQKVVGFQNEQELKDLVSKFAFIVKKADCLDLPEKVYTQRNVEMGPLQAKAYREMRDNLLVDVAGKLEQAHLFAPDMSFDDLTKAISVPSDGAVNDGAGLMTADLVITQMLRLHQILCGFMTTDDKKVVPFDEPNPRLAAVMETLEECSSKAIIWATYKHNVREIAKALADKYGPDSVVTYFGDTSVDDRRLAVKRFQDPNDPARFFVSNKTGARGLTLTQAKTAIYYSTSYNADDHNQSEDRCHRIGQTSSVTYVFIVCPGTQDEKIAKALRDKKRLSDLITPSNWRDWLR